ncbi:asparagine synthase (glutamine-hydrolyzing) [Thermodesulfobacteriota bacterium]
MCGFVGIINNKGQAVDYTILSQMAETLNHRGPDDEGYLLEGSVGFYHKRLSIIDLETGGQPMTSGDLTIVFNGEIYNYIELRQKLKRKGHRFQTKSDTEVILKAYEEYGLDAINQLNGMFAFLLLDRKADRLLAARDHFGIKPLYYTLNGGNLMLASEIKALLKHPLVAAEPDYGSIQEYLTFQYVLGYDTLFSGIHKLPPGHYLVFDLSAMKSKLVKYWELDFSVDTHQTEAFFIDKLRQLLEDTVRIQLRSDVQVGAYLSGGMDSSTVAILASSKLQGKFKTFTGAFQEGDVFDETCYAREAAAACKAEMFEIYPTEEQFIETLPSLIYYMDEPSAGPGLFPQYMVSKLASREVKVVLGGQGGDEIFGGYTRFIIAYLEQALKGAIYESNEEGEHIVSLASILPNLPALRQYVPMLRRFWSKGVFGPMDQRYFRLIDRNEGDLTVFSADFRASFDQELIFARFQSVFNNPNTFSYYNKMVHYDMVASLPALLHVEDRVSMANSIESRVPILDRRIVELVLSMPPAMKFRGAEMKYFLKRAVKDILPKKIYERKDKVGFPVPLHHWAKNKAKTFFQDVLLSKVCQNRGLFNMPKVEQLIKDENAFGRRLWGLLCLELWFQTFIDKN